MQFYGRFFISLLVSLCIWLTLVFFQIGLPSRTSQWVDDVYKKKTVAAEKIASQKILIVAGSNALFGVNSELIEQQLKIKTINYSVNAGIFLPYVLYKAKQVIKPGDIVLLPLEYSLYNYNGIPNSQMIDSIFSRDFEVFFELTIREQFYVFWNVTFKRVYQGYQAQGGKEIKWGVYGVHHVDKRGDQTHTRLADRSQSMWDEINQLPGNLYGQEYSADALAWDYLHDFILWCHQQGAKCIFMPSTLMRFESYLSDPKERWFYQNLASMVEKAGGVYIGDPYDYMYEKALYFNTDYHLIDEGRKMRTEQMLLDLKARKEF